MADVETLEGWLAYGASQGWVTLPFCAAHDGAPMLKEEWKSLAQGHDPCVLMMRIWGDSEDHIWDLINELDEE
jgi:hypothetical protein